MPPLSPRSIRNQVPDANNLRIGVVNYLNTKPLVYGLDRLLPTAQQICNLPSRLADALANQELDIALVPSIELARHPEWKVVSNACIACRGPVLSVKLMFRVPPAEVASLALDEGSRTSVMLAQILLQEIHGVAPRLELLPIGSEPNSTNTDAVLVIGDRAMECCDRSYVEIWDLGERWFRWAGAPFVFAMWVAREGVETDHVAKVLAAARDAGCQHLAEIARDEADAMQLPFELVHHYLTKNLHFHLGSQERRGLGKFFEYVAQFPGESILGREQPATAGESND